MKSIKIRLILFANSLALYILLPRPEMMLPIYALFALTGWFRRYKGSPSTPRFVGVLHNALSQPIVMFVELLLVFQFGISDDLVLVGTYSMMFGLLYFYGYQRFGWRVLVWTLITALSFTFGAFGSILAYGFDFYLALWNPITMVMAAEAVDLGFEVWEFWKPRAGRA